MAHYTLGSFFIRCVNLRVPSKRITSDNGCPLFFYAGTSRRSSNVSTFKVWVLFVVTQRGT